MENTNKKLLAISGGIIAVLLALFAIFGINAHGGFVRENVQPLPEKVATHATTTVLYNGEKGKDALTLLKEHATVGFSQPGMVNSINGRKADDGKHEYWAFYVNGTMAQVGAADYQTKDGDTIEWKIETY